MAGAGALLSGIYLVRMSHQENFVAKHLLLINQREYVMEISLQGKVASHRDRQH